MKIRILSIACVTTAAALLAACTTVSRNSGACEQLMRSKLAATSSDSLKVAHRAAAIRGSRVVVEGTIEHVMTASEVAAAMQASAARAASAARGAAKANSAAVGATAASGVEASSKKSAEPKTVRLPAAAECTFHGEDLDAFRWLAPAKLAAPPAQAASDTAG
ncbi:hypothetical protein B0G69_2411 [Paraburkholderia sp. RAU2J]|uniref:hypothetical protein n=1 Tax=Paraburkholderia sp. RAU2J TaxID=1938810 RepID=UPI000EAC2203|nr:hypothetical protein [Paraburkholderia sp. RAU2J]RKT26649.1 hypothetical protein B0G69_2411 [Paraburkholderia sp. RAU2J]